MAEWCGGILTTVIGNLVAPQAARACLYGGFQAFIHILLSTVDKIDCRQSHLADL